MFVCRRSLLVHLGADGHEDVVELFGCSFECVFVGFFVGEFGPFGKYGLPQAVLQGYVGMIIQGMNDDGVGWAYGSYDGKGQLITNRPEEDLENTFEKIPDSPYSVNTNMRDLFLRFTDEN